MWYSMCGMYGSICWADVGRRHVAVRGAKGGRGIDAGGASSVGFHEETRGRAGGWRLQERAELTSASKARALALVKAAVDRGAVRLLLRTFSGMTERKTIELKIQTAG